MVTEKLITQKVISAFDKIIIGPFFLFLFVFNENYDFAQRTYMTGYKLHQKTVINRKSEASR